jgi:hypothetical protein
MPDSGLIESTSTPGTTPLEILTLLRYNM